MGEHAWVVRTPNAKTALSQQPEFAQHATQHSRRQDRTASARATSSLTRRQTNALIWSSADTPFSTMVRTFALPAPITVMNATI